MTEKQDYSKPGYRWGGALGYMMHSVLFIAPFEELTKTAKRVMHNRNLDIEIVTASNEKAVQIAKSRPDKTILISRGGTANDLKRLPERTVVEITTTFSDILEEIQDAVFAGYTQIGIVTNNNIIDNTVKDFAFQNIKIWLRPCKTYIEIRHMVEKVCGEGADYIIGCHQAVKKAQELHADHAYIRSGRIAVERALDEALRIERMRGLTNFQMERLNAVINTVREGIVIFSGDHQPVYFNTTAQQILEREHKQDWYKVLSYFIRKEEKETVAVLGSSRILIKRIPLQMNHHANDVFVIQEVREIEKQERRIRLSSRQSGFYAKTRFSDIFTTSSEMKHLLERAEKFARTRSNILIYGATGTGKEGLAQSIHNASPRSAHPFVSVNCASLPEDLIESELFGYAEGAFTGARHSGKPGLFEMAHKGTIFLDEIGELPLDVQGRLLRVLQEREVMRIGDDRIIPLDIRVICATNRNLKELARHGKFRFDLYYRINVLRLSLPSLKERSEDIWPLFQQYFRKYSGSGGMIHITDRARQRLQDYDWPGNIRELKNVAEVLAFEEETITEKRVAAILEEDDLPQSDADDAVIAVPDHVTLKEAEKIFASSLLQRKSQAEVCRQLGISRITLWRKLHDVSEKK